MSTARQAVVIGASAGAFDALSTILPKLPEGLTAAIMIVVHIPPDRRSLLAELFQERCALEVKEAEDKEPVLPGIVYFAPPNYHLLVEKSGTLALSSDEAVLFSRPSIDVLFETAADAYGAQLTGVILTGANQDGAEGLARVAAAGGTALVQTPASASATAMPEAAISFCPMAEVLPLEAIAARLAAMGVS
ncbi:chemotaxis protein CheB [Aestuariivirga sp.]|uniref:chemotaxis protein CheB n=1 Tax=Aestuariivirga sp. TaxID=2650926 RepID=UPI003BABA5BB